MITLNRFTNFNFEYLIAGLVVALLYSIWVFVIKPSRQKKQIHKHLLEFIDKKGYRVEQIKKDKDLDFVLTKTDAAKYNRIKIKVAFVPKISTITINNKFTWNLHYGGTEAPGRRYPHNRYLDELIGFLRADAEEGELKLVIVYESTSKVQKYVNESELVILEPGELVYDYKVINFHDLNSDFDKL